MASLLHLLLACATVVAQSSPPPPTPFASFGLVTDLHYADAPALGTRVYRDSLPKLRDAIRDFTAAGVDFLMENGDFKDTDASQKCAGTGVPTEHCINITEGFLSDIEGAASTGFSGPRYHVLGNHDVDILTQKMVLDRVHNTNNPRNPITSGNESEGYYSFPFPPVPLPQGPDTVGCLIRADDKTKYTWIVHPDGTRNWLRTECSPVKGLVVNETEVNNIKKRHGGEGAYTLNTTVSSEVCATQKACTSGHLPRSPTQPLRFIILNADFTDRDLPWADLDDPDAIPGMSWEKANVPTRQLTFLATELEAAQEANQRVLVFVHYRLDGGVDGPVGTPVPVPAGNRAWVDDCTLQNALVVRAILEEKPGLVLATFSGHDHVPLPPYTKTGNDKPLYFTHAGMVEGAYAKGRNAYSIIKIMNDCSITIRGWGAATNVTVSGPPGCILASQPDTEASLVV